MGLICSRVRYSGLNGATRRMTATHLTSLLRLAPQIEVGWIGAAWSAPSVRQGKLRRPRQQFAQQCTGGVVRSLDPCAEHSSETAIRCSIRFESADAYRMWTDDASRLKQDYASHPNAIRTGCGTHSWARAINRERCGGNERDRCIGSSDVDSLRVPAVSIVCPKQAPLCVARKAPSHIVRLSNGDPCSRHAGHLVRAGDGRSTR